MIREYSKEDLESLWELYSNCWSNTCPFWQFKDAIEKGKTLIDGLFSDYGFIVSFIDEESPWIWTVVVSEKCRGEGVATGLLKAIEKFYPGQEMHLYVRVDNPAQKLYFDSGYRAVRIVKGIYDSQDALEMVKRIV
jgi:ribosomal protein S18 acetylase RimI-like enzyme